MVIPLLLVTIYSGRRLIMILNGFWEVFLVGCSGGLAVEILKWYKIRGQGKFPVYSKKISYWIITLLMILLSGFLTILYGVENVIALLALNIGISAPLIISTTANSFPIDKSKERGKILKRKQLNIWDFLRI